MKRPIPEDAARAAHARYLAGEQTDALAAELDVNGNSLATRWRRLGLPARQRTVATEEEIRAAHRRYVRGARSEDLASGLGITSARLRQRWRELGLSTGVGKHKTLRKRLGNRVVQAHSRHLAGESVDALARELGCSEASLYAWWRAEKLAVPKARSPRRVTVRELAHVRRAAEQDNRTFAEVCAELGRNPRSFRLAVRRHRIVWERRVRMKHATLCRQLYIRFHRGDTWDQVLTDIAPERPRHEARGYYRPLLLRYCRRLNLKPPPSLLAPLYPGGVRGPSRRGTPS